MGEVTEHKSCPSECTLVSVLVSYPRFPSSPRDVGKIDLPECLDLSWFINWEAVVERIRGKFQRGLSWGHLAKSCLMPDAFQLRLTERRNISIEGEQERKVVMLICFQWLFQAPWHSWAHVCPGHKVFLLVKLLQVFPQLFGHVEIPLV